MGQGRNRARAVRTPGVSARRRATQNGADSQSPPPLGRSVARRQNRPCCPQIDLFGLKFELPQARALAMWARLGAKPRAPQARGSARTTCSSAYALRLAARQPILTCRRSTLGGAFLEHQGPIVTAGGRVACQPPAQTRRHARCRLRLERVDAPVRADRHRPKRPRRRRIAHRTLVIRRVIHLMRAHARPELTSRDIAESRIV